MMRKFVIFLIIFSFMGSASLSAQVTVPEKVKIGLYYGSSALPIVSIRGESGVIVGYNENDVFNSMYEIQSTDGVSVRKDSYFVKSGSLVLEYKQTDTNIPAGEKFGPYHIQVGGSYTDKASVDQEIGRIRTNNIVVYPSYSNGSWFIWYGLYLNADSALKDIDTVLKPVLGTNTYTVIQPSAQRVQVLAGEEVRLMFEGQTQYLDIRPKSAATPALININGKNFRGEVEVRRYSTSDMTITNILPLEQYLYGVVPREIGASSPIEAIKAQAVAARNYSVQSIGKNAKWGFDMTNTVSDQAYGGYECEGANSNKGVDETIGKMLMYNGKLAEVFYFSTSGGRTEDVKNVWGSNGYPYLVSVEDKYESPNVSKAKWEVTLTGLQIKDKLTLQGYDLGDITAVEPQEFSDAGRVVKLLIRGTKAEKIFEREKCRTIFGKDILSQWYTITTGSEISVLGREGTVKKLNMGAVKVKSADGVFPITQQNEDKITVKGADISKEYSTVPSGFKFSGKGWGHGIGMSQEGAIGMAKVGFTYDQILKWYFTGTNVEG